MVQQIVLALHILISLMIVGLVLLQRGKGADAGTGFGAGASGTVFGARGSANFLSRTTAVLAATFFVTSLALAFLSNERREPDSLIERITPTEAPRALPSEQDFDLPRLPAESPPAGGASGSGSTPAGAERPALDQGAGESAPQSGGG